MTLERVHLAVILFGLEEMGSAYIRRPAPGKQSADGGHCNPFPEAEARPAHLKKEVTTVAKIS